jgi:hypothetical protein
MENPIGYYFNGLIRISQYHLEEFLYEDMISTGDMFEFEIEVEDYFPQFLDWARKYEKEEIFN